MTSQNTPFIRMSGEQILQQPFGATGVEYYGFILNADPAAIQANICDKLFNKPSGGAVDFVPFGPWFVLVFNNIASLSSVNLPDSQKGWFTERESAAWVLLFERKSQKLYWHLPHIYVDNSYALCMGRETYGFPKGLGRFDISYFPEFASYFSLDTIVLDQYAPVTKGSWANLWTVKRTTPAADRALTLSSEIAGFLEAIAHSLLKLVAHPLQQGERLLALMKEMIHGEAPMVFLKQFPSVSDPTQACYQAIVEVPIKMTHFYGGTLLPGDYTVAIQNYDSHPVRTDLGLKPEPIKPVLSFFGRFDFLVSNGRVLWQA